MITIFETPYCTLDAKVTLCANVETLMSGFNCHGTDDSDQSAAVQAGLDAFNFQMNTFWDEVSDAHDPFFQHWNGGKHVQFSDFKGRWYAARIIEGAREEDDEGEPLEPQTPAEVREEQRKAALAQTRTQALLDLCNAAATRAAEKVLAEARKANAEWLAANPAEVES
jgi:hypothetical protein